MTDPAHRSIVKESSRRSRIREDLVVAGAELKVAHLSILAEKAGVSPAMARMALDGKLPYFRPELSPVKLGLLVEVPRERHRAFAITAAGEREARRILIARAEAAERALRGLPRSPGAERARRGKFRF